jgi:hypothetical protein
MTPEQKDRACAHVLMDIWKIIHRPPEKSAPTQIVTEIAKAIYLLPAELLNSISAEVKRKL